MPLLGGGQDELTQNIEWFIAKKMIVLKSPSSAIITNLAISYFRVPRRHSLSVCAKYDIARLDPIDAVDFLVTWGETPWFMVECKLKRGQPDRSAILAGDWVLLKNSW